MGINGETFLVLEHETREMCFAVTAKVFGEKSGEFMSLHKTQKRGLQRGVCVTVLLESFHVIKT